MIKLLSIVLSLAAVIGWGGVAAAAASTPSGVTVSPAFQQVTILASQPEQQLNFTVTNNRPTAETINLSTQDFNALSDSGGLFFVGTNPTQIQKKYGLANWLSPSEPSVTIPAGQSVKVTATIRNDQSLAPGGHYGALMLALSDGTKQTGNNVIAVHPIASSLLFINKLGGDTHKLKLSSVHSNHTWFKLPSTVTLRFYNDGNTHLTPRGTVTLTSPSGKVVSQGVINENSSLILPQVYRSYSVPLSSVSVASTPGNYKLAVNFRFDGIGQFRAYQTRILFATPGVLVAVVTGVAIAVLLARYFLRRRPQKKPIKTAPTKPAVTPKKSLKVDVRSED